MNGPSWQSTVIAIAFVALVGYGLHLAVTNDFQMIWTGLGPILGVVVGVIPGYFFAARAKQNEELAQRRADALQQAAPPEVVDNARRLDPSAF